MAAPRKKAASKQATKLAEALNFVGPATADDAVAAWKAHARIAGNMMTATNGLLSAGHPVEEEIAICPHVARFIDAINKAGKTLSLTPRDNGQLLVAGDNLKATVPCVPGDQLPPVMPDPRCADIDDRIKEGFNTVVKLAANEGDRVVETSLLLRSGSVFACNGSVIFEYWHGIDLPPGLVIPKPFAVAVGKAAPKLEGFGFSQTSVTFYFEGGAWMKTQLYAEAWPDIDNLFNVQAFPADIPPGLFEGVRAVENFSKDGGVHFHDGKLKTTYDNYSDADGPVYGATYDVPGLQAGHSFTASLLKIIEPACTQLDYTTNDDRAVFVGENVRGVIMKRMAPDRRPEPPQPVQAAEWVELPADAPAEAIAEGFAAMAFHAAERAWGAPEAAAEPPEPLNSDTAWAAEHATFDKPADPNANVWASITATPGRNWNVEADDVPF